jgi:hypothetical protein
LGSLLVAGALTLPLGLQAQDRDDHHDRDDRGKNHRVYDRDRKDYHQWNDSEDRAYRQWYEQRYHGKEYRDFNRLKRKDQDDYWKWRHQRGDNDDRHRDNDERH